MHITKELFEKLSKKNQEEYRKKFNKIREINFICLWSIYIYWMIYFVAFMLIVIPLWKIAYGNYIVPSLLIFFSFGIKVLGIGFAIGVCIDVAILLIKIIKFDEIKKEYFKLEVK